MFDVAVIGAGPAGVSCAIWLKQLGFTPVVVEKNSTCGGLQLLNPYSNTWIATTKNATGGDVAQALHENLVQLGISMQMGVEALSASFTVDVTSIKLSNGDELQSRLLVLASGVTPKTGGLASRIGILLGPGHAIANTNFVGAKVAILGGRDNAFENYGFAKNRGAHSVQIFARSIRARVEQLEKVPPDDVTVGTYRLNAEENSVNGERFDHILVLYGYEVSRNSLLGLDLAMRTDGFISTDADCKTSHPNVYAIGEVAGRMHPCCVTSMADGVVAAKAIQRRLESTVVSRYIGMVKRIVSLS